ncbi:MAG: DUF222 domain-containing protein [Microbacterium sp.]|nr:DUF222 domain-containing protein [Microbacterium sp.]
MSRTAPFPDDLASDALDALVSDLVATRAMMSALHAHEATVLAGVMAVADAAAAVGDRSEAELHHRSVAAEVAAALRVPDRTVQRQLADAALLIGRFPATHDALRAGLISRSHVAVIMDAGRHLVDPDDLARYEAMILPYAQTVTAGRLRPVARLRVERVVPSSLQDRHDRAVALRGVRVIDGDDGTADLHAFGLKAAIAHGIHDRLTALAHRIERGGATGDDRDDDALAGGGGDGELVPDARTMDQLRPTSSPTWPWPPIRSLTGFRRGSPRSARTCRSPCRFSRCSPAPRAPAPQASPPRSRRFPAARRRRPTAPPTRRSARRTSPGTDRSMRTPPVAWPGMHRGGTES